MMRLNEKRLMRSYRISARLLYLSAVTASNGLASRRDDRIRLHLRKALAAQLVRIHRVVSSLRGPTRYLKRISGDLACFSTSFTMRLGLSVSTIIGKVRVRL